MDVIVQKYGGSSLATVAQIKAIADSIDPTKQKYVLVVSAMGSTTDELSSLGEKITSTPKSRELDMLLSAGERISMAMVSMALNALGKPAISFTGSQAGILTDSRHGNAQITGINPLRVQECLDKGTICVIAGFQGVCPETKEVTTLGRGGSDTTAVALAAHFKSPRCEFKKDVCGVYSASPKAIENPKLLSHLRYDTLLEMSKWGCEVLHHRAVEYAQKVKVPLHISHTQEQNGETLVDQKGSATFDGKVVSIQSHKQVGIATFTNTSPDQATKNFDSFFINNEIAPPLVLQTIKTADSSEVFFVLDSKYLPFIPNMKNPVKTGFSSLTLVAQKQIQIADIKTAKNACASASPLKTIETNSSISFIIRPEYLQRLTENLYLQIAKNLP